MNYRVVWKPAPGYSCLVKPGDAGLEYLGFGILSLAAGKKYSFPPCDQETALVLLKGSAAVSGQGLARQTIGPRQNIFTDRPWTVLLPARSGCEIEAVTDTEIAVCQAPSTRPGTPLVIGPDKVKELNLGKPGWQRRALIMIDENVPAELLFIGEAFVPPCNWASYPPHRHDFDDLPHEVNMEEVYYFRFDRPQAFGIQKIYTDNRSIDETLTVAEHHTVLIPEGYHPVAAAPGYPMYYLWIMAGRNRRFLSRIDPDHRWMLES